MDLPNQTADIKQDEISIKEVILKIQEWLLYLLRKWKLILLFGILGAGLGFWYASTKKINYASELSFVLEENKSGGMSSYASLASAFNIDLGGGSGNGIFSGENLVEFLKSRLMIEKTLLSPISINGKTESLADYYASVYPLRESWNKKQDLKNISFPVNTNRSTFSIKQDSLLGIIYNRILTQHLVVTKKDKKLSFINVSCTTQSELFSKVFTERLVKEATDFYVETKTKRSKSSVDKLQAKADSLEILLNRKTYSVASTEDLNLNPAKNVARVNTELGMRDKVMLQTMYAEVVKNLEMSKMAMAQETPIIQVVDTPILPLKKVKSSRLIGMIAGSAIAGFLVIIWLVVRRVYKLIMS